MNAPAPQLSRSAAHALSTDLYGWFCVGFSADLGPGDVQPVTFFGRETVLFRTASGAPAMVSAHCPHLGAHLGYGGRVVGEHIVCPFHKFEFDARGRCAGTACSSKPPHQSDLQPFILVERGGMLLTWHDPLGRSPLFDLPSWELDHHTPLRGVSTTVASHPQETSENSVDFSHFTHIHNYRDVRIHRPIAVDGPHLTTTYRMQRPTPGLERLRLPAEFEVHVWGLGLSIVHIRTGPLRARLFILSTPSEPGRVTLRAATQVRLGAHRGGSRVARMLGDLVNRFVLDGVHHDVEQDRDMWEHKRFEPRPRVVAGDGPIGRYRKYVRQFYV